VLRGSPVSEDRLAHQARVADRLDVRIKTRRVARLADVREQDLLSGDRPRIECTDRPTTGVPALVEADLSRRRILDGGLAALRSSRHVAQVALAAEPLWSAASGQVQPSSPSA
jgi:hypothetical protein